MILLIAVATFLSTLFGGLFALRFKDKLHLVLGFSAGAVIGVAFFDLLPEALELGASVFTTSTVTSLMALGFVVFMIIDRFALVHCHDEEHHHTRGHVGAGSLSIHSFLDGLAIGFAFHVSPALGTIVTLAVLAHDFSDGINTVNLVLKNGGDKKSALGWLSLDALAPVLGIIATFFFTISESTLAVLLSLFCGFFLYIGASDLLPESHHAHPTLWTSIATILGVVTLYTVINLASI